MAFRSRPSVRVCVKVRKRVFPELTNGVAATERPLAGTEFRASGARFGPTVA